MQTSDAVYDFLLSETMLIRSNPFEKENGKGFAYRPVLGLLRGKPDDKLYQAMLVDQEENIKLFGLNEHLPSTLNEGTEPVQIVDDLLAKIPTGKIKRFFFEGYELPSDVEDPSDFVPQLASEMRARGLEVICPTKQASDKWNNKACFRDEVTTLIGNEYVPNGAEYQPSEVANIVQYIRTLFTRGVKEVVVKTNGIGGMGNLLVNASNLTIDVIQRFIHKNSHFGGTVVIEQYVNWDSVGCISFFIRDSHSRPVHMATCEQIFHPQIKMRFDGCREYLHLSERDKMIIEQTVRPVVEQMQQDGVQGILGIDILLGKGDFENEGILQDSGYGFKLLEANPRINGHNQDGLTVALAARRDGLRPSDLTFHRMGCELKGTKNRQEAVSLLAQRLKGVALPYSERPLEVGKTYFHLHGHYGEEFLSQTEPNVLLFGARNHSTMIAIDRAVKLVA